MSDLERNIPVAVDRFYNLMCVSAPEVRTDRGTGEIRKDRASGKPLYIVGVLVRIRDDRKAYVLDVTVPGEPESIAEGVFVEFSKLTVTPWVTDTGNGVVYRAEAITAARPTTPAASIEASTSAARAARTGPGGGGSS